MTSLAKERHRAGIGVAQVECKLWRGLGVVPLNARDAGVLFVIPSQAKRGEGPRYCNPRVLWLADAYGKWDVPLAPFLVIPSLAKRGEGPRYCNPHVLWLAAAYGNWEVPLRPAADRDDKLEKGGSRWEA